MKIIFKQKIATSLGVVCSAVVLSAALLCVDRPARAQTFPDHEITLIVNYGAGGNTDVATRALGQGMEKVLGKPVVIQNKPGALGTLTPAYIARQKPDGYQVGVVTYSTIAIMPHLMDLTGGKFEQISYKSGAETVTALLSGNVSVIVQNPSDVIPHIQSGKLRMLASASPMRWPEYPDVLTMKEQGFDVEIDSWLGLAVPKGTAPGSVAILQNAVLKAMQDPALTARLNQLGVDPAALTGKAYLEILEKGYIEMGRAIKAANLPKISG